MIIMTIVNKSMAPISPNQNITFFYFSVSFAILRVSLTLRVIAVKGKSQTQPVRGEGCSGNTTGYPVTVLREEVALLRRGTANTRGDEQKSG